MHLGLKRLTSKMQDDVFGLFLRLCKDETPLVRRLAAQSLEAWARLLSDAPAKQKELVAAYKNFINDDQVRCFFFKLVSLTDVPHYRPVKRSRRTPFASKLSP